MTKYFDPETRVIRALALAGALMVAVLIAYLSLAPSSSMPRFQWSDKVQHFIAYAVLTLPLVIAFGRRRIVWAILLTASYGVLLEFAQGWLTDNRVPSLLDAMANLAGGCAGALLALVCFRVMRYSKA